MGLQITENEKIGSYKNGIVKPINDLHTNCIEARKILTGSFISQLPNSTSKKQIQEILPELDNSLKEFIRYIEDLNFSLSEHQFEKSIKRIFFSEFPKSNFDKDKQKQLFIKLKLTAQHLRYISEQGKTIFNGIKKKLSNITYDKSIVLFLEKFETYRIDSNINLLKGMDHLNVRMAKLLKVKKENHLQNQVMLECQYMASSNYHYSELFSSDYDPADNYAEVKAKDFIPFSKKSDQQTEKKAEFQSEKKTNSNTSERKTASTNKKIPVKKSKLEGGVFLAEGDLNWNKGRPYQLVIDSKDLLVNEKIIKNCIHIDVHLAAEENKIRGNTIRRFISKKIVQDQTLKYDSFLYSYFSFVADSFAIKMRIPAEYKTASLFHLGPHAFAGLVLKFMLNAKTGFVHVFKPASKNKILKIMPTEYINYKLSEWWSAEVVQILGSDKNNKWLFQKLTININNKYEEVEKKIQFQLRQLYYAAQKKGRNASREDFQKEYLPQLMGIINMTVFKRFLGKIKIEF